MTIHAKILFELNQTSQRERLLAGRDAKRWQTVQGEIPITDADLFDIDADGKLSTLRWEPTYENWTDITEAIAGIRAWHVADAAKMAEKDRLEREQNVERARVKAAEDAETRRLYNESIAVFLADCSILPTQTTSNIPGTIMIQHGIYKYQVRGLRGCLGNLREHEEAYKVAEQRLADEAIRQKAVEEARDKARAEFRTRWLAEHGTQSEIERDAAGCFCEDLFLESFAMTELDAKVEREGLARVAYSLSPDGCVTEACWNLLKEAKAALPDDAHVVILKSSYDDRWIKASLTRGPYTVKRYYSI